jgi:hypothetical protein
MTLDHLRPAHPAADTGAIPPGPPPAGHVTALRGKIGMYRALRTIPQNRRVPLRDALAPLFSGAPAMLPVIGERYRHRRRSRYEQDMRLLNDVLADSPLDGRYWVWGGLLLGWAREGRVLEHDMGDADFGFVAEDEERFDTAEEQLVAAGFRRWFRFHDQTGRCTQRVLVRHGSRFEFFRMDDVGAGSQEFHVYGPGSTGPVEVVGHLPRQELEPFVFLGRSWMKPRDHELLLRTCYGDWRTPAPSWGMFDDRSLVTVRPWTPGAGGGT